MARKWVLSDMPSQAGKLALVTGANRGLGLEVTCGLAKASARVVMACRDVARAEAALKTVRQRVPNAQVEVMPLDLASLDSVRAFASAFSAKYSRLDILCNNASAIMVPQQQTHDGFEMHFGVNHLGHFALTGLLMEALQRAPAARVVNLSSLAHGITKGWNAEDPNGEQTPYTPMEAYGRSKLLALLFTLELSRRLRLAGSPVMAVTAHPGYSNTNPELGGFFLRIVTMLIAQPPEMGALPLLYAATAGDVQSGDFIGPSGLQQLRGYPKKVTSKPIAQDAHKAAQLWTVSEQLTGVRYR